jgi:uncharacterized protein YndB with AHSA1/START domain
MMSTAPRTNASAGFTVDRDSNTIRFERELAAPPSEAFAAWTDPEQVSVWWDPTGVPLTSCDIDARAGGTFKFVTRDHSDMPFTGTYREVSPPNRLVFEAMGAEGRVILTPQGHGSLMTVEIVASGSEHLDQFIGMGVAAGTSQTLDNLAAHLERAPTDA